MARRTQKFCNGKRPVIEGRGMVYDFKPELEGLSLVCTSDAQSPVPTHSSPLDISYGAAATFSPAQILHAAARRSKQPMMLSLED